VGNREKGSLMTEEVAEGVDIMKEIVISRRGEDIIMWMKSRTIGEE
jgi:hypothetical protein